MATEHTPLTKAEAVQQGYTVDDTCYPWLAYKGPRFACTETREVYTEKEEVLVKALEGLVGKHGQPLDTLRWNKAEAALKLANGEA